MVAWLLFGCLALVCQAAEQPFRVLLIHSFGRDYAPFHSVTSQFRTDLARQSPKPVEFVEASLEMARFDGSDRDLPLVEFLHSVFRDAAPDLLVPVGAPAALFLQRHRSQLFATTPALLVGIDARRLAELQPGPLDSTMSVRLDLPQIIDDIVKLRPQTNEVLVVLGSAPLEKFWEMELKNEWLPRYPRIRFRWLSDKSLEDILTIVSDAPDDAVVFHAVLNRDAAGVPHVEESALDSVRKVSAVPVFGYCLDQVGLGVVGGRLVSMKSSGADAADTALAILTGKATEAIRAEPRAPSIPTYDWRELRRWQIPESALPVGSVVLHRQPGLWETHRSTVLIALAVGTAQGGLILMLLAARRQARESHATLEMAADAANAGFWRRDLGRDEIDATPRWRRIFALPEQGKVALADVLRRVHLEDVPRLQRLIEESPRDGQRYEIEHRIVLPDGGVRWIHSIGRTDSAAGAAGMHSRGISIDITARKGFELEIEQQRSHMAHLSRVASLGELSGSLAHELNQPLGSILANAQAAKRLMDRNPPDLAELREILADIIAEDQRAGEVIARLKALLKHGESHHQPVDVEQCIDDTVALLGSELAARGIEVQREPCSPPPQVMADSVQLQQVLLNLIANACDAMNSVPAGGRFVTLRNTTAAGLVCIEVEDCGTGTDGDPERLFEPFFTTKPEGLGMGLAICRTIVAAHNGRLWAERRSDRGLVFCLTLPELATP